MFVLLVCEEEIQHTTTLLWPPACLRDYICILEGVRLFYEFKQYLSDLVNVDDSETPISSGIEFSEKNSDILRIIEHWLSYQVSVEEFLTTEKWVFKLYIVRLKNTGRVLRKQFKCQTYAPQHQLGNWSLHRILVLVQFIVVCAHLPCTLFQFQFALGVGRLAKWDLQN